MSDVHLAAVLSRVKFRRNQGYYTFSKCHKQIVCFTHNVSHKKHTKGMPCCA
jgi:hypothetical protein